MYVPMMRPFMMFSSTSWVIGLGPQVFLPRHRRRARWRRTRCTFRDQDNPVSTRSPGRFVVTVLGRPRHLAAGFGDRRRGLVAGDDRVDPEQILGIVRAL